MKKLLFVLAAAVALVGCDLDDNPIYYELPDFVNISYSPELDCVTANDEVSVSATVINYYGTGYTCVKYWVCNKSWESEEDKPQFKIDVDALYQWIEPTEEGKEGEWKKLASMKHTEMLEIVGSEPFKLEAKIPKQSKGKYVFFSVFCTNDYGINDYSQCYEYTVLPAPATTGVE